MIASIHHGACKNGVTGFYDFCTVHAMGQPHQTVYPIGFCRENNKKGNTPCQHKTEEAANQCYQRYELEYFVKGTVDPKDIIFPKEMVEKLEAFLTLAREALVVKLEQEQTQKNAK